MSIGNRPAKVVNPVDIIEGEAGSIGGTRGEHDIVPLRTIPRVHIEKVSKRDSQHTPIF
jgi:hypothetical protein